MNKKEKTIVHQWKEDLVLAILVEWLCATLSERDLLCSWKSLLVCLYWQVEVVGASKGWRENPLKGGRIKYCMVQTQLSTLGPAFQVRVICYICWMILLILSSCKGKPPSHWCWMRRRKTGSDSSEYVQRIKSILLGWDVCFPMKLYLTTFWRAQL